MMLNTQLLRSAMLSVAFVFVVPVQASAKCAGLPLRTFTPEERQQFESQHGMEWWKTIGLIPGPAQPGDWVERPWGDSSIHTYMPQQFWDPRACADTVGARPGIGALGAPVTPEAPAGEASPLRARATNDSRETR